MRYLFFFYLLMHSANCFAQNNSSGASSIKGFIPREKIIFEDDFSDDSLGHSPHKWKRIWNYDVNKGTRSHAIVRQEGADKVLSTNGLICVKPTLLGTLTDSFTVECEFMLKGNGDYLATLFSLDKSGKNTLDSDYYYFLFFWYENQHYSVLYSMVEKPLREPGNDNTGPKVVFSHNKWYHLGFSYNHRHISCYLDSTRILDIPNCGFQPFGLSILLDSAAICRQVTISNGKLVDFTKLITEKKFVTHAILFETNKAEISEDSWSFLSHLAKWLKKNPAVSIEIDGHTDSVGSAASNLDLSLRRAEEVKNRLVMKGVPAERLTTKGLGATMPLKSNKTEEGKAENRRVEFILLDK